MNVKKLSPALLFIIGLTLLAAYQILEPLVTALRHITLK